MGVVLSHRLKGNVVLISPARNCDGRRNKLAGIAQSSSGGHLSIRGEVGEVESSRTG